MTFKNLLLLAGAGMALALSSCSREGNPARDSVQQRGELVVAVDAEMPGHFVLGGESYGYPYDLFKAYADYLGVELRVVSGASPVRCDAMLSAGQADIVATLDRNISAAERHAAVPVYHTSYVLLATRRHADKMRRAGDFDPMVSLRGVRLLVSSGFKGTKIYNQMLDSLSGTEIYISSRNSFELMEQLADGKYDYLICEQSEAQLGCALVRQVEQVCHFKEQIPLFGVVSPMDPELKADFASWLDGFRNSEEYAVLNDLYFEKGIVRQVLSQGLTARNLGGISPYDKMIKRICASEGYDWRLISAIVYSESRFNPYVVSRQGARGLMQVMPRVARQFGASGDIMDPEHNVLLGIKILGKIERSLDFDPGTSQSERMKIILACYNGGIGHVLDARNLARKYGDDPDSWEAVSHYLTLKGQPEYAADEIVKCGRFNSRETLAFVDQVYAKYGAYCNNVTL